MVLLQESERKWSKKLIPTREKPFIVQISSWQDWTSRHAEKGPKTQHNEFSPWQELKFSPRE